MIYNYTEVDTASYKLIGADRIAPWRGVMLYDYYQVAGPDVISMPAADSGGFPLFYVAVGGGIAAIVGVGAAVYFFFIAGGGAESAAGGAGAAGGGGSVIDEEQNAFLRGSREVADVSSTQVSDLQSLVAEDKQYLSQEKNSDLAASEKHNTISKAQNQPGHDYQSEIDYCQGGEQSVENAKQVDSDKSGG